MLTLFTIPKPFRGDADAPQRRALASWRALGAEVIVFGDEEGVSEAAREAGARHEPAIARTELGTPLVSAAFEQADALARTPVLAYANADVLLSPDLPAAIRRIRRPRYLLVGRRREEDGTPGTDYQLDWFAFPRGVPWRMPPFAVGRPVWDNWLIWRAHDLGLPVIDASRAVRAVHQTHGYGHVPEGRGGWEGPEGDRNRELMGGTEHRFSLRDATHVLVGPVVLPGWTPRRLRQRLRRR